MSVAEQVQITNNEDKISNSSTPMENEKLQRMASMQQAKNKIELNVEMTEEMKRQEQSLNFGGAPFSSRTSVQNLNSSVPRGSKAISGDNQQNGHSPQSLKKQKELIEFKRQGQQGV